MNRTNKIGSWIAVLGFALTTLASAEVVKKLPEILPVLKVTLKCVAPDGKTVGEISSYITQHPGREFYGKLPIDVGGSGNKNLLIVAFGTTRDAKIKFEISDTSLLQQVIKDGTSTAIPLEILDVEMPRTPKEGYEIYSNRDHKLSISFMVIEGESLKIKE